MTWVYVLLLVLAAATATGMVARARGVRLPGLPGRRKPYVGRHTARWKQEFDAAGDTCAFPVVTPPAGSAVTS